LVPAALLPPEHVEGMFVVEYQIFELLESNNEPVLAESLQSLLYCLATHSSADVRGSAVCGTLHNLHLS
jgi:hypothetical protein